MDHSVDYIIVGAGTAGCILAHRLSEDPAVEVMLLEAGGPADDERIRDATRAMELQGGEFDWQFETVPQPELNERTEAWARGKVLGGSSSINGMLHLRGHPSDFDAWAARGNDGWSYEDVLPYFKRSETYENHEGPARGGDGPIHVVREPVDQVGEAIKTAACRALDLQEIEDYNAGTQEGVAHIQRAINEGRRSGAVSGYIDPVRDRDNLEILTRAYVTQVLLDGASADGVECLVDGTARTFGAREEVILACGSVQSPQLLMLSGIGPRDHLKERGIDVALELPGVGRNLQNHLIASVICETNVDEPAAPVPVVAFERVDPDAPAPELQYTMNPSFFQPEMEGDSDTTGFTLSVTYQRPRSRGRIMLASSDPQEHPVIDPNYFEVEEDLEMMVRGITGARRIAETAPLSEYRERELRPGPDVTSEAELEEFVRENARTTQHPVGTCKMGSDDMAVVDDRLRVHGIDGLRVIDASIMPTIPSANTNAATIAVAERGAALIE